MNRPEPECTEQSCIYSQQNCNSPRDSSYNKRDFANSCATDAPKKKGQKVRQKVIIMKWTWGNGKPEKRKKNRRSGLAFVAKSLK
jgi:hypothetical protein